MSEEELRTEEPLEELPEAPPKESWEHRRERDEEEEKFGGWEDEKQHEKEEKGRGWSDPLGGVIWALILIAAGLIFLAESTLGLADWGRFGGTWNVIFLAVGVILLFEVAVRLLVPAFRRPVAGTLVFAFIMLAMGLSGIIGWNVTFGVVVIAMGIAILISGLLRGRF